VAGVWGVGRQHEGLEQVGYSVYNIHTPLVLCIVYTPLVLCIVYTPLVLCIMCTPLAIMLVYPLLLLI